MAFKNIEQVDQVCSRILSSFLRECGQITENSVHSPNY
jgi:hypothetical protein